VLLLRGDVLAVGGALRLGLPSPKGTAPHKTLAAEALRCYTIMQREMNQPDNVAW
jgi:hypothetical protein